MMSDQPTSHTRRTLLFPDGTSNYGPDLQSMVVSNVTYETHNHGRSCASLRLLLTLPDGEPAGIEFTHWEELGHNTESADNQLALLDRLIGALTQARADYATALTACGALEAPTK